MFQTSSNKGSIVAGGTASSTSKNDGCLVHTLAGSSVVVNGIYVTCSWFDFWLDHGSTIGDRLLVARDNVDDDNRV
jgi:hypothetical protein